MLALSLTAMDKQSYNSKNGKGEFVRRRIKKHQHVLDIFALTLNSGNNPGVSTLPLAGHKAGATATFDPNM